MQSHHIQIGSGAHPIAYPIGGTTGSSFEGKAVAA